MKTQRTFNLAWPVTIAACALLIGGAVWGFGAQLFEDPTTNKSYPNKTVAGFLGTTSGRVEVQTMAQPRQGQALVAGCGTATGAGTSTVTCAAFRDLPTFSGTLLAGSNILLSTGTNTTLGTSADLASSPRVHVTGITGMPSGGTPGQVPQVANTTGTYTYTATGTPTGARTGTQTTTSTGWAATNGTIDFDPMGTYFFLPCAGECLPVLPWRLGNLSAIAAYGLMPPSSPVTLTATCSTGSDALLSLEGWSPWTIIPWDEAKKTTGKMWPGGAWLARLRAKVNANGAAIRVHVYEIDSDTYAETEWFNFTTGAFSNTDYATVEKLTDQAQRMPSKASNYIGFRFYATCSTSTTVSLEFGDAALTTRIESPIVVDRLYPTDIFGLNDLLEEKQTAIPSGTPSQLVGYRGTGTNATTDVGPVTLPPPPSGKPGQVIGFDGTGTATVTSTAALNREPVISGTPGQFVKIAGTGTSTATSKTAVTVTIPTPITTRSFYIGASAFDTGSGATKATFGSFGSGYAESSWLLRNAQSDAVFGAVIKIPADFSSSMTVSPHWFAGASDSNTAHTVRWKFGWTPHATGSNHTYTTITWTGTACGVYCNVSQMIAEAPQSFGSFSANNKIAVYLQRFGSDGADTYTGDAYLVGVDFSYTSTQ